MKFKEWISTRQDARTWNEEELAVAELTWNTAVKISDQQWELCNQANKARIATLEKDISWLEHHISNLENGKMP